MSFPIIAALIHAAGLGRNLHSVEDVAAAVAKCLGPQQVLNLDMDADAVHDDAPFFGGGKSSASGGADISL